MTEWELPSTVETTSIERIGGGFAWESGVYDAIATLVYMNQAASGAVSFNVVLKNAEGKELKESFWIKSGNAKGNKTYYTNSKTGKDHPLPGYSVANSMCVAITGDSLAKCLQNTEKKTINIWNSEAGKEMPTERPVVTTLLNKKLKVAVHQVSEDKTAKNEAGQYVPTGTTRTVNECKFFGNEDGKTAEELLDGKEATMFDKWAEKNTGSVIDKTTKQDTAGASAASIMGGTTNGTAETPAQGSMFS